MTSIAFNIHREGHPPSHDEPAILSGREADGWESRAEAARRARQGQPSARECKVQADITFTEALQYFTSLHDFQGCSLAAQGGGGESDRVLRAL